jgi:hypothetical protein
LTSCVEFESNRPSQDPVLQEAGAQVHPNDEGTFRLLLNNLIIFFNLFGKAGTDMLLYKVKEEKLRGVIAPLIMYLGHANDALLRLDINIDESIIELLDPNIVHEA